MRIIHISVSLSDIQEAGKPLSHSPKFCIWSSFYYSLKSSYSNQIKIFNPIHIVFTFSKEPLCHGHLTDNYQTERVCLKIRFNVQQARGEFCDPACGQGQRGLYFVPERHFSFSLADAEFNAYSNHRSYWVHPKGDQSWVLIAGTGVEAETPILWPPDVKSWLIGKDPDAGKDWGQEEKGMTEDEMVGWHHWHNGHGFG